MSIITNFQVNRLQNPQIVIHCGVSKTKGIEQINKEGWPAAWKVLDEDQGNDL
jgi:hypothetical protein